MFSYLFSVMAWWFGKGQHLELEAPLKQRLSDSIMGGNIPMIVEALKELELKDQADVERSVLKTKYAFVMSELKEVMQYYLATTHTV